MRKILYIIGLAVVVAIAGFSLASVASAEKPPAPPGKDPCSHGNTGKPCRPDPQPDRGKDCEKHGKEGGVNEDHCKGETTPPPTNPPPTNPPPTNPPPTNPPPTTPPPTQTTPGETTPPVTTTPAPTTPVTPVVPPPAAPPKAQQPPKQPGVEGPTPPSKTPKGKPFCPNGTPVYKGKCFPKSQGSG